MITRKVNKVSFPEVTGLTKSLSIGLKIIATIKYGNDMIKYQIFCATAINASFSSPFTTLTWGKLFPMSPQLWRFIVRVMWAFRQSGKHFITIFYPSTFQAIRHFFSSLSVGDLARKSFFWRGFSLFSKTHFFSYFRRMCLIPERIALTRNKLCKTISTASFWKNAPTASNLTWTSIKRFSTDCTIKILTLNVRKPYTLSGRRFSFFHLRHLETACLTHFFAFFHAMPPSNNWVNSEKHFIINPLYGINMIKSTLSQALKEILRKVQRLQDEPKGYKNYGSNFLHERPARKGRYSLSRMATYGSLI